MWTTSHQVEMSHDRFLHEGIERGRNMKKDVGNGKNFHFYWVLIQLYFHICKVSSLHHFDLSWCVWNGSLAYFDQHLSPEFICLWRILYLKTLSVDYVEFNQYCHQTWVWSTNTIALLLDAGECEKHLILFINQLGNGFTCFGGLSLFLTEEQSLDC